MTGSGRPDPFGVHRRRRELAGTKVRHKIGPATPVGALLCVAGALAALWVIVLVDAGLDHRLVRFGIRPRSVDGLWGIVLAPVIHADAGQLAAISIPFAALGWLALVGAVRTFAVVTGAAWLLSGVVSWLAGPSDELVVGASGVLFGWFGYVLARAWYSRKISYIGGALFVAVLFSSLFTGLLPKVGSHVFWGGQLAGFLAGLGIAAILHRRPAGGR
jgi:membrane associated rhomboid family serine protease